MFSEKDVDNLQGFSNAGKTRLKQTIKEGNEVVENFKTVLEGGKIKNKSQLQQFIERVERLEEEKQSLCTDIKEIFAEAKSAGFDVKIMRKVIRLRKMDSQKRAEESELLEVYAAAIGLQYALPI